MIHFPNNTILIQSLSELPNLNSRDIVLDFETTSGDSKIDSLNPYFNCDVAGIGICTLDSPAYYIPLRHKYETPHVPNLYKQPVARWLFDVLQDCDILIGHNCKYDAHILQNALGITMPANTALYDTLTQAKIVDSDRLSYGLDSLSKDWLSNDISQYEAALAPYLFDGRGNRVNRDYGEVPAYIMAPYCGQDVLTTRDLKKYVELRLPESCKLVSQNEVKLTKILLNMEDVGLCVNSTKVQIKQVETQFRLIQIMERIGALTGRMIRPNVPDDCYNLLCGQYGLPVLFWTNEDDDTKDSNPSFDKEAMASYAIHPRVQEDVVLKETVGLIKEYKVLDQFNNLFLNSFIGRNKNGLIHSTYNQAVRTARLSCSDPNAQQMSALAKALIETPGPDWVLVDIDLSQIEFRLIASTLNNRAIINKYNSDPATDYHQLIADLAGIDRKPAKNLNFAVGFAAGRKKAISMVKGSLDISSQGYKDSGMQFDAYCQMRAETMYNSYHRMLPELKQTIENASNIARKYGYISNLYGRRRHFKKIRPVENELVEGSKKYYTDYIYKKAFNSYIQSSAADLAKDLTIRIDELICNEELVKLVAVVHDSWLFYMHKSIYMRFCIEISRIIRNIKAPGLIRVPILNSCEVSRTNWAACKPIPNFEFSV